MLAAVSKLNRFAASWLAIERREGQTLKQLKTIATVRSVGASTRIEGSRMSDAELEVLLRNTDIAELEDRNSQEVIGCFQVLDLIAESYADIDVMEDSIKGLHNQLLRFSRKDEWHRGNCNTSRIPMRWEPCGRMAPNSWFLRPPRRVLPPTMPCAD